MQLCMKASAMMVEGEFALFYRILQSVQGKSCSRHY